MKNSIIILIGVFVFITGNVMAATPVDGHYEGETSQELVSGETGNEVSFDVINGVPQDFYFNIKICTGTTTYLFENFGLPIQQYWDKYAFVRDTILDTDGRPVGVEAGSEVGIYGRATFINSTTFIGEIWNVAAFFSGNGLETTICSDTSVTFQANFVGPADVTNETTSSKKRVTIVIEQE